VIKTERINATRVLVVDDEPSIVDAVATSLRYEGFTVDEATTGCLALALAQKNAHALVILDVRLPDLNGMEVTRRLRADGVLVPVIFLTARGTLQDKVEGLTVGGDDYVLNPSPLAELIARVHSILRRTALGPDDDVPTKRGRTSWRRSAASTLNTTFVTLPTSIRSHVFDCSYVRHAHSERSSAVALRESPSALAWPATTTQGLASSVAVNVGWNVGPGSCPGSHSKI